jgi:S1-C subfamily serine protease
MRADRAAVAQSLVRIRTKDASGSGVAVTTPEGLRVLTCAHVVEGADEVDVIMRTEVEGEYVFTESPAEVVKENKRWDLALLKIVGQIDVKPIMLAREEPELYEAVILAACPNASWGVVLDGILQGTNGSLGEDDDKNEYLFSGLSAHGSSGGAVCNADQELVGIITSRAHDEETVIHLLGYAAPLSAVKRFIGTRRAPRRHLRSVPPVHAHVGPTEFCQLPWGDGVCGRGANDPIHEGDA